MKIHTLRILASALALASVALVPTAQADSVTWTGSSSKDFSDGPNWNGGETPSSSDIAIFSGVPGNGGAYKPELFADASISGIQYGTANSNWTLEGAAYTLTLGNAITVDGIGSVGIDASKLYSTGSTVTNNITVGTINLAASQTWIVRQGGLLNVTSTITGDTSTLTVGGKGTGNAYSGTVKLSGENTFGGGLVIKSGIVMMVKGSSVGTGKITIGDEANTGMDATLRASGNAAFTTTTNDIDVVGNGTNTLLATGWSPTFSGKVTLKNSNLTIGADNNSGSTITVNGSITGTGNLTTFTNGTGSTASRVILSGSINNTGSITVTAGSAINNTTTGRGTVISGTIGSNVTDIIAANTTSGGIGWLTLTGANNAFTGKVDIQGGLLRLGSGGSTTSATFLTDTTSLYLYTTNASGLYLNFASNSVLESVSGLYIDGVAQSAGTWGAVGSGAQFESALITGTGMLNVTGAIPEPATLALLAGATALGLAILRRRRR